MSTPYDPTNFAERDRHLENNPTLDECRRLGRTHRAYGWGSNPWGHWPEERKAAYEEGYREIVT